MRWINPVYKMGDTRIKTKFLLLPKTISGETRWFERVYYIQKFHVPAYGGIYTRSYWWEDVMWVSKNHQQLITKTMVD